MSFAPLNHHGTSEREMQQPLMPQGFLAGILPGILPDICCLIGGDRTFGTLLETTPQPIRYSAAHTERSKTSRSGTAAARVSRSARENLCVNECSESDT